MIVGIVIDDDDRRQRDGDGVLFRGHQGMRDFAPSALAEA
jgi:hypothetical protein